MIDGHNKRQSEKNQVVPCQKSSIMIRDLDEETMLYDPDTKHVHILNKTALLVWQFCDGRHSIEDVVAAIAKSCFLIPEQRDGNRIEQDVRSIINDFEAQGIVE
jgi:hypothetical protein